jgi:hypothetical protein
MLNHRELASHNHKNKLTNTQHTLCYTHTLHARTALCHIAPLLLECVNAEAPFMSSRRFSFSDLHVLALMLASTFDCRKELFADHHHQHIAAADRHVRQSHQSHSRRTKRTTQ